VLRRNDRGAFTTPSPRQYPHQWNWDAALIALGLSHFDLPRALVEIHTLLCGQWRDGMLPHIVYHTGPSDYFPDPAFWQTTNSPNAPDVLTSGITQPPLLASVVRQIHARTPVLDFVREVFPALQRWHRWLHSTRDADGSGLVCLIHPWESGTDDSPRWLRAMANITPIDVPPYRRGDRIHVTGSERPNDADYDRFVHLMDIFRRNDYAPSALLNRSPFLVQDVLFNSILYRADADLQALAVELRRPTDETAEIEEWLRRMRASFSGRFWDEDQGLYFDYDLRLGAPIAVNTFATFMPLYAGLADDEQARRLIHEHWRNPTEYAPDGMTRYSLTTASKTEPVWEARRYWRGPVWIIANWLLAQGLGRYGFHDLAEALRRDALELIARSGFREYYDPHDGSGCGSADFSWSAALALDFLGR
jgi:glycogen debranching enzyme